MLRCAGTLSLCGKDVKGRLKRSWKLGLPITILETVLFQIASVSCYYERKLKDFYIKEWATRILREVSLLVLSSGCIVSVLQQRYWADLFIHCFRSFGDVFHVCWSVILCVKVLPGCHYSSLISCLSMLCLQVCLSYGFLSFCHPLSCQSSGLCSFICCFWCPKYKKFSIYF